MSLTCDIVLGNVNIRCEDVGAPGGVRAFYAIQRGKVVDFTASTADHSYTAVTTASTGDYWVKLEPFENTGTATAPMTLGDSGGRTVEMTIEGFFNNQEAIKAFDLQKQVDGGFLIVIAKYSTSKAFVYGYDELLGKFVQLRAAVDSETGAALGDRNGYLLRYTGSQGDIPRQYIGTIEALDDDGNVETVTFAE